MGRSTGADGVVTKALNDEKRGFLPFEHKVDDLLGALTGRRPGENKLHLRARPLARHLPVPWILGSSGNTARMAAEAGLGFTFAHFINPGGAGARAAKSYRGAFRPSIHLRRPEVLVAVFVVIAETDKDVCALAKALHTYLVEVEVSEAAILPSPRTASQRRFSSAELARIDSYAGRVVVGTPQRALAQLQRIAADYGTDQVYGLIRLYRLPRRECVRWSCWPRRTVIVRALANGAVESSPWLHIWQEPPEPAIRSVHPQPQRGMGGIQLGQWWRS